MYKLFLQLHYDLLYQQVNVVSIIGKGGAKTQRNSRGLICYTKTIFCIYLLCTYL